MEKFLHFDCQNNINFDAEQWIADIRHDVKWLKQQQCGCCTHKLDDRLAICVGWHDCGKEDWQIYMGLYVWTSDDLRTDLDWINMPYLPSGEVFDYSMDAPDCRSGYDILTRVINLLEDACRLNEEYDIDEKGGLHEKKPDKLKQ